MKRLLMMILIGLAVPACGASLRDRKPLIGAESDRSVEQISSCLSETMGRGSGVVVGTNVIEHGLSVTASSNSLTGIKAFVIADVRDHGGRRTVSIWVRGKAPKEPRKTYANLYNCI